jgi:hypothetical protein
MPEAGNGTATARLAVVAPESYWDPVRFAFRSAGMELEFVRRRERPQRGADAFGLEEIIASLSSPPAGLLLVAPRRRAPLEVAPGPVWRGIPVGIVQADRAVDLGPWLDAISNFRASNGCRTWASLAMAKDFYLSWGRRMVRWMKAGGASSGVDVMAWLADAVSQEELCRRLAAGPQLAVYIGHGRARGWSGYTGLRWRHVAAAPLEQACGTVIALSCDTLRSAPGEVPFGCRWIREGRACAYLGSVAAVGIHPNAAFAKIFGEHLATGAFRSLGHLLAALDLHLAERPHLLQAARAFQNYRLIGNPLQPL